MAPVHLIMMISFPLFQSSAANDDALADETEIAAAIPNTEFEEEQEADEDDALSTMSLRGDPWGIRGRGRRDEE